MELIPAIDVLRGEVVRLEQGDYDRVTVYGDDPTAMATSFEQAGATHLHVVDLDGAREGRVANGATIERILEATSLKIQVGGGIRTREVAERWIELGVKRVVLGTVAVKNPELAWALCREFPQQVVVAIDGRGGQVAVEGWTEQSQVSVLELAQRADGEGAAAALYTNIDRDGMSGGPDVKGTSAIQSGVAMTVIASGGIGSLDHLRALQAASVRAAVCGRALYSGAFTLGEAFAALEENPC